MGKCRVQKFQFLKSIWIIKNMMCDGNILGDDYHFKKKSFVLHSILSSGWITMKKNFWRLGIDAMERSIDQKLGAIAIL